ncbi:MAG TPA: hypothetical protein PLQ74_03825 [Pseudomonadota bacterium]|nr:DUF11 domain-containing protein [Xanthomonadales bacterium]HQW80977.1 hypothetical protein [Pseudomonadota bacterium]
MTLNRICFGAAFGLALSVVAVPVSAQDAVESLFHALNAPTSLIVRGSSSCPASASVIYDTTHASLQGAEITAAANGAATCMGDNVVTIDHTLPVCEIVVDVFTLAAITPFDLTLEIFTDCTTSGTAGSACGTGSGTLIASSTTTVTGITPPPLGTIFSVVFPVNNASLATEVDNTISVKINASRSDVYWRLDETPAVGSIPAGEPATSVVQRCGSAGANNGCARSFGVNNNFAMTIRGAPLSADLSITKDDGVTAATAGGTTTYSITASNAGPSAVNGATVADTFPAACTSVNWTCTGAGAATCTANGSGNINDTVNLPSGGSVTYSATCAISPGASGSLSNTATVTGIGSVTEVDGTNNTATDTDTIAVPLTSTPVTGSTVTTPTQTLGSPATTATILFQNPGLADATVTCVAPAAPFSASPLNFPVVAGGSASTVVSFNSAVAGSFVGTLNCSAGTQLFVFNLAGSAGSQGVPVPTLGTDTRMLLVLAALIMGMVTLGLRARRS